MFKTIYPKKYKISLKRNLQTKTLQHIFEEENFGIIKKY